MLNTVLLPTLLYSSEIWALQYSEPLESCQLQYFKNLFLWPKTTPNYIVRLETGITHIMANILKLALNWLVKVLLMPNNRFPKACFLRLKELDTMHPHNLKYNWASEIHKQLTDCGFADLWDRANPIEIKE